MSKRQVKTLHNPKLIFKDRESVPILEFNIDQFPELYKPDWYPFVVRPTKEWLRKTKYKGRGTLWAISNPSLNFGDEWVQSVFVIVQGFRETFFGYLLKETKDELENLVTCLENTVLHRDYDGWNPIAHVEQGRVFRQVDVEEWEEI